MFQTELLSVRRNSNRGTVTPIFLGEDSIEYARMTRDLFRNMVGRRKRDIHEELKDLELKVQFNKVIKGIGEILLRESRFTKPGSINSADLREKLFTRVSGGVFDPQERRIVLQELAKELNSTPEEIDLSLYSDMEEEEILLDVSKLDDYALCLQYNLEQAETLLLKALSLSIKNASNWQSIAWEAKRLGLMFNALVTGGQIGELKIDGPLSAIEETRRYSIRFSQLLRSIIALDAWSFDSTVVLEREKRKEKFTFHLDSSSRDYFPPRKENRRVAPLESLHLSNPIIRGNEAFFPDYFFEKGDKRIYFEVSRPRYRNYNEKMKPALSGAGIDIEIIYLLGPGEKQIKGELCYKDAIPWDSILHNFSPPDDIERQPTMRKAIAKIDMIDLKKKVDSLWPHLDKMFGAIEALDLDLVDTLREFGYSTRWEGLSLKIAKKNE